MHLTNVFTALICSTVVFVSQIKCSQIIAAPYFMPIDNNPPNITEAIKVSGLKTFVLAFILAPDTGGCVPTWDGNSTRKVSDDTIVLEKVKTIRALGGDVSVSFGGYTGLELGHSGACSDAKALASAYQSVIDKYSLTNIDLDIEGDDLGDIPGENKRFQAIKILKESAKSKSKQLFVSLTLPTTTIGLSDLGKDEINRAIDDAAVIDLYKIMAFDYGGPAADMANDVMRIMALVHSQIKTLRTDLKTDAEVNSAIGLTLMNGHTDQPSELFSLDTFKTLLNYAKTQKYGRMSFWALNRDRNCTGLLVGWVDGKCSSVSQQTYDFSKVLAQFHL